MGASALTRRQLFGAVAAGFAAPFAGASGPAAARRPNTVLIVADDMGFSDLACYGSEIHFRLDPGRQMAIDSQPFAPQPGSFYLRKERHARDLKMAVYTARIDRLLARWDQAIWNQNQRTGPCHRPPGHLPRRGGRRVSENVPGPPDRGARGPEPWFSSSAAAAARITLPSSGSTRAIAPCAKGIGSSSPATRTPEDSTTWKPIGLR